MNVNGCDCSIVIKTQFTEMGIPYSEETIREAVSLLQEEAAIEGDGVCGAIQKYCGVTGCVVTPLSIETAPLLLYLALGSAGLPVFVSETRDVFRCDLHLLPVEDCSRFTLIQDRGVNSEQLTVNSGRRMYEGCWVNGFELRFDRGKTVHLKLDVCGERPSVVYPYTEMAQRQTSEMSQTSLMSGTVRGSEKFSGDCVSYRINGAEYSNIYGLTLSSKKEGGCKTELWIKRALQQGGDLPGLIEELVIEARLLRDTYDNRYESEARNGYRFEVRSFGMFRITVKRLVLVSDETDINSADGVIGPLRYYVAGGVAAEVFSNEELGLRN